jgi:hypothetical protein
MPRMDANGSIIFPRKGAQSQRGWNSFASFAPLREPRLTFFLRTRQTFRSRLGFARIETGV